MPPTSVSIKGQVTIPKPVRELLDIKPGDLVVFEISKKAKQVVLKKVTKPNVLDFAGKTTKPSGLSPLEIREVVKKEVAKRLAMKGAK